MAQLDNVPIMARSGEYVVRKEAVDELGTDFMDMINNADRLGYTGGGLVPKGEHGHSAIDELLAINTLNNQDSIEETRKSAGFITGGDIDMSGQEPADGETGWGTSRFWKEGSKNLFNIQSFNDKEIDGA